MSSSSVDTCWEEFLPILRERGWLATRDELLRRIAAKERLGRGSPDLEPSLLVLATLQQKFGELHEAARTLGRLTKARDSVLRTDATVRLAKLLSQKGEFSQARETLRDLIESNNVRQRGELPSTLSPNVLWRLGFLDGIAGEARKARYWLDRHRDSASRHGSQTANNQVFGNILYLLSRDFQFAVAHDANARGLEDYLADEISVTNVKFLSVAKSVVVPLLLDGSIMLLLRNTFSGVLQVLLCRRLLQFESISLTAEGIGETIACLRQLREPLLESLIDHWGDGEEQFLVWLGQWLRDPKLVEFLVAERERIFACFVESRDYRQLSLVTTERLLKKAKTMPKVQKVFLVHGHDELNLLRLKDYLSRIGGTPVLMKDMPAQGQTLIEKFESAAAGCDAAVVLFTTDDTVHKAGKRQLQARPNVMFEIGWFYGRVGRRNVTIVYQRGVTLPSDLDGIARVEFDDNVEDIFDKLRSELGL